MSSVSISPALSRPRSPPYGRLPPPSISPSSRREREREERLINAFEAEEERIINVLSRKLEQLREEKISLERLHEEEEEARVNRLARELAVLRVRQHQAQQSQSQPQANGTYAEDGSVAGSSSGISTIPAGIGNGTLAVNGLGPPDPSAEVLLNALKKENENLRSRLGAVERDYVRLTRLNEVYREELIQHRRRLGISVDNLIGLSSASDPYSQPTHRRGSSTASTSSSSPTASMVALPTMQARPSSTTHSVPIPRPSATSNSRRAHAAVTPASIPESPTSASSIDSPSPVPSPYLDLSPVLSALPASYASGATNLTTPPSSASLRDTPPAPYGTPGASSAVVGLSYPSVPPPSLSSSLGSPVVMTHMPSPGHSHSGSGSGSGGGGIGFPHERRYSQGSRRTSVERGARIAETGSLVRSRTGSTASQPSGNTEHGTGAFVPSLDETRE